MIHFYKRIILLLPYLRSSFKNILFIVVGMSKNLGANMLNIKNKILILL
jgi:hypothetical protein